MGSPSCGVTKNMRMLAQTGVCTHCFGHTPVLECVGINNQLLPAHSAAENTFSPVAKSSEHAKFFLGKF
jgi:hypothetical protein